MKPFVLDAAAILAFLMNEPGADRVKAVARDAAISAVNLAEIVSVFARRGNTDSEIEALLSPFLGRVVPFDAATAFQAGLLAPQTRAYGLSLGDRACLALARSWSATAVTADRVWGQIGPQLGISIEVIR